MNERQRHRCHQNQYQYRPIERMERLAPQTNAVERIEQRQCNGCFGNVNKECCHINQFLVTSYGLRVVASYHIPHHL